MPRIPTLSVCSALFLAWSPGSAAEANQSAELGDVCDGLTKYATAVALAHQTGTPYSKVLPIAEDLRVRFGTEHPIVVLKAAYALPRYAELD